MRGALWKLILAGSLLGGSTACLVELEHSVRCGDGYVDLVAGEQCDPGDPSSYENACLSTSLPLGTARCNPETCQIEADAEACAFCGDGVVSPGEQCEGASLGNRRCPSGEDLVTCDLETCRFNFEACPRCGNGVFEPEEGEECEWNFDFDIEYDVFDKLVMCEELEPLGAIDKSYSQGEVGPADCTKTCQFSRTSCSFCGDGVVDGSYSDLGPEGSQVLQGAEICDGNNADSDLLAQSCKNVCESSLDTLRCDFECLDECSRLEIPEKKDANCCIRGGESCTPMLGLRCCFALDNGMDGDGCQKFVEGEDWVYRCPAG